MAWHRVWPFHGGPIGEIENHKVYSAQYLSSADERLSTQRIARYLYAQQHETRTFLKINLDELRRIEVRYVVSDFRASNDEACAGQV